MSQVNRILKIPSHQRFVQRFYASYKTQNHYDVLGVDSKASKKDIREAFLNLSKQMHPDMTKKDGHTDFVKITEAYNVLSKDASRREYDAKLMPRENYQTQTYSTRPYRTKTHYYRGSRFDEWNEFRQSGYPKYTPHDFYEGFGGEKFKPVSKVTVVIVCLVVSALAFGLQLLAVSMSPTFDRSKLIRKSEQYAMEHRKLREKVLNYSNEENIEQFRHKAPSEFVEE